MPVYIRDSATLLQMGRKMFEHGIYTTSVAYPVVKHSEVRFRFIVNASHTYEQMDQTVAVMVDTAAIKIDTSKQIPGSAPWSCETFKSGNLRAEQIDFVRRWRQSQIIPVVNQQQEATLDVAVVFKCNTDYSLRLAGILGNGKKTHVGSYNLDKPEFAELIPRN